MTEEPRPFRRLVRAVHAFVAHRQDPVSDDRALLEQHADVADLLEPLLRPGADAGAEPVGPAQARAQSFLGGFKLLREIGRGGMGVVYEAEEFALGRRVALKVLPNQPSLTARQIERFRREAAAAARLKHQGIVPVYSVGEVDGTHYFAMEYVEGASLGQALRDLRARCAGDPGRLDAVRLGCIPAAPSHEAEAAEIVAQAAEAVAAAHAGGVLHRDLKPHNILVDHQARVRVVDFGLAKDLVRGSVTRSGEVAGTPHYMSPEQALGGRGVDARTDVFALGVVLYELLTLRVPFQAETPHEVLHAVLTREPEPIRRLNPRVCRDLETICLKAMDGDAHYRYRTAGELAAELRRFQRLEPITARPPGSMTRLFKLVRRHKAAALAAASTFLVVVVGPLAFAAYQHSVRAQLEAQESATARERDKARTNFARARRLLEQQLERVEQLGREPGMETLHRQMADDALAYYREFLDQPHTAPEDAELELQALQTHVLVARIHLTIGEHERALEVVGAALDHVERRRAAGAVGAAWGHVHADLLRHRAAARRAAGQAEAGNVDLRAAVAQLERALAVDLDPVVARAGRLLLAQALHDHACAMLQDGTRSQDASDLLARAVELVGPQSDILSPRNRAVRVAIQRRQGELLRRTGRHAEAEPTIAKALEQTRAAHEADPDDPEWRSALATVTAEHGSVLLALRRVPEAEAAYRAAIAERERLVRDFPRAQEHRHGLQVALYNLALLLHNAQRNEEATAAVRQSIAVVDDLLAESPNSAAFADQGCRAANLACLIESALHPSDTAALAAAFSAATARVEAALQRHPDAVFLRSGLGAAHHNHAMWLMRRRQWSEAKLLLQRAIEEQAAAHAADPSVSQYRDFLYNHWQLLGQCLLALADAPAAARATHRAADLLPARADVQLAMAYRVLRCANLARKAGDEPAVRGYEDDAMRYVTRAVDLEPHRTADLVHDEALAALRERTDFRSLTGGN